MPNQSSEGDGKKPFKVALKPWSSVQQVDSCSIESEFNFQHWTLDGQFFIQICWKIVLKQFEKTENKQKETGNWRPCSIGKKVQRQVKFYFVQKSFVNSNALFEADLNNGQETIYSKLKFSFLTQKYLFSFRPREREIERERERSII